MGNEGRQLRSRLVELCIFCQKPVSTSTGKFFPSHIHCTCATPPNASISEYNVQKSPKKRRVESEMGVTLKQQLFKESNFSEVAVNDNSSLETLGSISSLFPSDLKIETKSKNENVKKSEVRSRHTCIVCSKNFNTPGKLNQHMYSHTGEKPFVCSHCSKAFSSKFKLVRHILIHSDLRQYRCIVCDRTFHRKDHLKNHSKVHSPIKRRFKCDRVDCGKEYSSILSYRKHIAVHSAEEGNQECKICLKRFGTKEETLFHLKVHAGSRSLKTPADRKYHCDHCDRSFFTGKDVRRHLVVHTGRRDFLCQYCPQRFGRKDHLTRHIKKSHTTSARKIKAKKLSMQETDKNKYVDNILREMLDEKSKRQINKSETVTGHGNLYKMQTLDNNSDDVMKLESSPNVMPIVTIDVRIPASLKVQDNLDFYNILDTTNIPYKYEHFAFESFPFNREPEAIAGPSNSQAPITPELIYEQTAPPPPPPPQPYSTELTFDPTDAEGVKVESDEALTLDLVLPPITNLSPSLGNCLLSNADFQNLLSTSTSLTSMVTNNASSRSLTGQLFNFLPTSNELIASLLNASPNSDTNFTPLPGFSQAFHQPP